jgi:hypothetical protein
MRVLGALLLTLLAIPSSEPSISYFTNVRQVAISAADRQNYAVVDAEIWKHARRDLADIRLFDGRTQVPYVLRQRRERTSNVEQPARILNLGTVGDRTEFDVDLEGVPEYDRIRLQLDAKNFVNTALVFGMDELGKAKRTQLAPSTLYDFSREDLGSNFVLKIPTSSFRYLHVQLGPGLRAQQVKSATAFNLQEQKAAWSRVGNCGSAVQKGRMTVIDCDVPAQVPLDRLQFDIPASRVNFRRNVSVGDANGVQIANSDISRVRMRRGEKDIFSEELAVSIWGPHKDRVTVTIQNGDDPPLPINSVEALAVERRIYFDSEGKSFLKLYYGDTKLEPPMYDYPKFFQEDLAAVEAQLGPGMHNAEYTGRPDERPWSERHKSVLWAAMLIAVALLAGIAVRGLRSTAAARQS